MFQPISVYVLLQFLHRKYWKALFYNALLVARSAVSLVSGSSYQDIPSIKRFFKGVGNLRPALPKYNWTWDPQCVLQYFNNRSVKITSSILDTWKKLITLLALTTCHRLQTPRLININIQISLTKITIFIPAIEWNNTERIDPTATRPSVIRKLTCVPLAL